MGNNEKTSEQERATPILPRVRYSVKDQIWITTWAAVWLAGWVTYRALVEGDFPGDPSLGWLVLPLVGATIIAAPYAVFGALFGRMWLGFGFGILVALASLLCLMFFAPSIQ